MAFSNFDSVLFVKVVAAEVADSFQPHGQGLLRELNPGPLAPEARIIPLDQAAIVRVALLRMCYDCGLCIFEGSPSSCGTHATPALLYFVPKTHMCEGTPGFEPGTC